jgi:NADH-quinone oxidoreductase subunit L
MIAAVGIGAYIAAVFHLFTHAFFKALLFLGSGSVIHGMEHGVEATADHEAHAATGHEAPVGVQHSPEHIDAQDMFNMGGLRRRMPVTFWTFLIGGFALSGFPLLTAGFWSKDEILSEAFGSGHLVVFVVLALGALLTAFYTMRQITLTFLGAHRTPAAEHAVESKWTMTVPLLVLAVFAVGAGWIGIPEHFPVLGGLVPNWLHEFVGGTLLEAPSAVAFNFLPLLTSLGVVFLGLLAGWLVYRRTPAGAPDPLARALGPVHTLLRRKYFLDELYDLAFVRPAYWLAESVVYKFLDRTVLDGFLHAVAAAAPVVGTFLRKYIDLPVVNGSGDLVGEGVKRTGRTFRVVQAGRVQGYLIVSLLFAGLLLSYVLIVKP